mmetsp:Transcript_19799/g.40687  ORF Transcript_19799/g.40687 Transcript_19799/m.40687 type:complete len:272 (+) Transcript_19799:1051-1866(+)
MFSLLKCCFKVCSPSPPFLLFSLLLFLVPLLLFRKLVLLLIELFCPAIATMDKNGSSSHDDIDASFSCSSISIASFAVVTTVVITASLFKTASGAASEKRISRNDKAAARPTDTATGSVSSSRFHRTKEEGKNDGDDDNDEDEFSVAMLLVAMVAALAAGGRVTAAALGGALLSWSADDNEEAGVVGHRKEVIVRGGGALAESETKAARLGHAWKRASEKTADNQIANAADRCCSIPSRNQGKNVAKPSEGRGNRVRVPPKTSGHSWQSFT